VLLPHSGSDNAGGSGFVQEKQRDRRMKGHTVLPPTDRSWLDMIRSPGAGQNIGDAGAELRKPTKDVPGKSATSPGVVDWDGPDKEGEPPRDWSGWGRFPGAEYLGLPKGFISIAPSPSPSPLRGEGCNISPPLRGGDEGEGDVCGYTNDRISKNRTKTDYLKQGDTTKTGSDKTAKEDRPASDRLPSVGNQ
jgi:hypothetical protein